MPQLFKFFIISCLIIIQLSVSSQNSPQQIIEQSFKNKKEIYFSFQIESTELLKQISKIISIDKVDEKKAFAYANRKGFEKFLEKDIPFDLLNHPNFEFKPEMYNSNLKKSYEWNQYLSYEDYTTMMYSFAADFPEICQVFSLGQTIEGREILVAKISDNIQTKEAEPQFFYTAQMHGDELVTSILTLRLIDYLTQNYGTDSQVTHLVNSIEIWINPMANPDGTYAGGNATVSGATRFNANAIDLNRNFPDPQDGLHPDGNAWQTETLAFMSQAENQNFVMSANLHSGAVVVNYPWDTWEIRHADDNWWQLVSREYADLAQLNSPPGYMESYNDGIVNGYDWYEVDGGRQDYMNYFQQCREFVLELSIQKMLPASELPAYWDYNKQAMLNYLEQVTYGFRGTTKDEDTGEAIVAKVEIVGHDYNESHVFSDENGNFYRPIKAGLYNLKFSAPNYVSKTVSNQLIADFSSKIIDISLKPINSSVDNDLNSKIIITNPVLNGILHIEADIRLHHLRIFSAIGQLILDTQVNNTTLEINLNPFTKGVYFVELQLDNGTMRQEKIILP